MPRDTSGDWETMMALAQAMCKAKYIPQSPTDSRWLSEDQVAAALDAIEPLVKRTLDDAYQQGWSEGISCAAALYNAENDDGHA